MDVLPDIPKGGYEERPRWLTSSPLDYQLSQNQKERQRKFGTTENMPEIPQGGHEFDKAERLRWLTNSPLDYQIGQSGRKGSKERAGWPPDITKGSYEYRAGRLRFTPSDYQPDNKAGSRSFSTTGKLPDNTKRVLEVIRERAESGRLHVQMPGRQPDQEEYEPFGTTGKPPDKPRRMLQEHHEWAESPDGCTSKCRVVS